MQITQVLAPLPLLVFALYMHRGRGKDWSWVEFLAGVLTMQFLNALVQLVDRGMEPINWWSIAGLVGIIPAIAIGLYLGRRRSEGRG